MEDVKRAIRSLKNKKSPGEIGILHEILKNGGKPLLTVLFRIFTKCWNGRCIPDDFRDTNFITLYKNKGDPRDWNNYRGISLLCIARNVFPRLLLPRVCQIADRILPESQCGFRPSRSKSDTVFFTETAPRKKRRTITPAVCAFHRPDQSLRYGEPVRII